MRKIILLPVLAFSCLFVSAQKQKTDPILHSSFLDSLLNANADLRNYLQQKKENNIQIVYTKIDRDSNNAPSFTDYYFNLNHQQYFYPASMAKLPVALLSLEKLHEGDLAKHHVTKESIMITDSSAAKQEIVMNDPSAENGSPSIAHYIKKIFLVSNNDAYNRLYEFLGQAYIQKRLKHKGYNNAIIRHRFFTALTDEDNKKTNPISFYDSASKLLYEQEAQYSKAQFSETPILLGNAHYAGGSLRKEPFNFAQKNKIYLDDLHEMLKSIMFPELVLENKRFSLTNSDYQFLYKWMSAFPRESKYPYYDSTVYDDDYAKYFLTVDEKKKAPANIRIFNKVGQAYGFLTDVAYIIDTTNKVEFILSATISCNSDGVYNDDKYDYEKVGFPFLKLLGKTVYDYELQRERTFAPNLTKFTIDCSN